MQCKHGNHFGQCCRENSKAPAGMVHFGTYVRTVRRGGVVGGITEMRTVYDLEPTGLRGPGAETFCSIWEGI